MKKALLGSIAVLPLVAAGVFTNAGSAQAITLGPEGITLGALGSGSFTVGDKEFSAFTCSLSTSSLPTQILVPNSCNDIKIVALPGTPYGINIQGPFSATNLGASGVAFLDALIGFNVEALDPGKMITNIGLAFNGAFSGLGRASVTETAYDGVNIIGQLKVSNPSAGGSDLQDPALEAGDFDLLYPVKKLRITKDILVQAGPFSSAEISSIEQRYTQDPEDVPEPTTLAGLGIVAASLAFARNRKKNKA